MRRVAAAPYAGAVKPGAKQRGAYPIRAWAWLLLAVVACPIPARAEAETASSPTRDAWLASDKQLHASASLAIAASIRVTGGTEWQSFGGAAGVGILKEAIDAARKSKRGGRGASWKDLVADLVGAAAGVAIVAAMDR